MILGDRANFAPLVCCSWIYYVYDQQSHWKLLIMRTHHESKPIPPTLENWEGSTEDSHRTPPNDRARLIVSPVRDETHSIAPGLLSSASGV